MATTLDRLIHGRDAHPMANLDNSVTRERAESPHDFALIRMAWYATVHEATAKAVRRSKGVHRDKAVVLAKHVRESRFWLAAIERTIPLRSAKRGATVARVEVYEDLRTNAESVLDLSDTGSTIRP